MMVRNKGVLYFADSKIPKYIVFQITSKMDAMVIAQSSRIFIVLLSMSMV